MLETLDDVPWSELHHAYGSAADVPAQLRALLSDDAEVRKKARWDSYGNIFHQGTRYEATPYAVPFLLEMLAAPSTPERDELIALLVALAIGYDEAWLPHGFPAAEQSPLELRVHEAVAAGVPMFVRLLEDDDPAVRRLAAYALGWFPSRAALSVSPLAWALLDADEPVAATAAVSLGLVGDGAGLAAEALSASFAGPRPVLRGAAALGLARLRGEAAPPAVVEELLRWSGGGETTEVPFYEGNLSGYATVALRQVLPDDSPRAFDALLTRIPSVSGLEALPVVGEALRRAFDRGAIAADTAYSALTERQQRLVRVLATSPETWLIQGGLFANFSAMVGGFGLPGTVERMRDYAGTAKMP